MALDITMPRMGYDMTEGTVVRWLKREGEDVAKNEVIAEIETDKAVVEMEAEKAGVLRKIVVQEGATVPVGEVLGYIGTADEEVGEAAAPATTEREAPAAGAKAAVGQEKDEATKTGDERRELARAPEPTEASEPTEAPEPTEASQRAQRPEARVPTDGATSTEALAQLKISPVARRIADQHGVDPSRIDGTGPGGRVTKTDVESYVERREGAPGEEQAAPARREAAGRAAEPLPEPAAAAPSRGLRVGFEPRKPGPDGKIPLGRMGMAIARRTQQTMQEAPLFYLTVSVDMTKAMELRKEINASLGSGGRVSVNDMIVKACAIALTRHPVFNATFEEDHLRVHPSVNVGIAVALPEGLVVPAVLDCERKSLVQISREAKDVGERARSGSLRQEEYTGTFSVSNLGMFDVDSFTAIIVSPQVAVLATGSVRSTEREPVRQTMSATLSVDHRAANGAEAAQFAHEIKGLLESPLLLLL